MIDLKIFNATSNFNDITEKFLSKIISFDIKESINGQADSINLVLSNNENSSDWWPANFFQERNLSLQFVVDGVNFGVFNFDEVDFNYELSGDFITMRGLIAPVTTGKSIYQQIRKAFDLNSLENILKYIANLANLRLDYSFDDFKLKMQVQNEFLFNTFTRLADKYGAVTKIYRENGSDDYSILFYGVRDIAIDATVLKKSQIAGTLGRGKGLITIDKNNIDKSDVYSINFKLVTNRKELKCSFYDPTKKRTYTKTAKNKTTLYIEDSRRDFEIVKVTSKDEANIVARRVEDEPPIIGEIVGRWNRDYLSGNVIEFINFNILSGFYLIRDSNHTFNTSTNDSMISFERLPDTDFADYVDYFSDYSTNK